MIKTDKNVREIAKICLALYEYTLEPDETLIDFINEATGIDTLESIADCEDYLFNCLNVHSAAVIEEFCAMMCLPACTGKYRPGERYLFERLIDFAMEGNDEN